ncbi:MAG: hypothetical protein AAGA83_07125 [Cyanobacteria bacterium P01_F01_bin.116]
MIKRFIAPIVALLVVVIGLTFVGSNYEALAMPSEADQVYFLKHIPDKKMVVVEPNYGSFYHPDPSIQGDSSGKLLYGSLDELADEYEIKGTKMVRFERKGKMIPNLYVFVDPLDGNSLIAEAS